jgi:signal transduction histidine kinase
MFIPASSEFVALCKSQVAVLTQGLGAALSAVYLTEELVEGTQAKLIPVVVYPETTGVWEEDNPELMLPELRGKMDTIPRLSRAVPRLLPQVSENDQTVDSTSPDWEDNFLGRQRQVVLPLMHEGVVMGLLVTGREDRSWNEKELATIERIARTLAIAYIMDQRRVWYEQQLTQSTRLQAQQRDRLDDLLHQLRNPLTALRTFGKLLIKRLIPGDKNRDLASSIVRESDRLQELLKEFDTYLDTSQEEQSPLLLPAATVPEASPTLETDKLGIPSGDKGEWGMGTGQDSSQSLIITGRRFGNPYGEPQVPQSLVPISVAAVLEPLIDTAKAIAVERNLELFTEIPSDLPLVRGNAKGLREVLSNLIDNALKYTPPEGKIDIRVGVFARTSNGETLALGTNEGLPRSVESVTGPIEQRLAILITDTGPGIPPQDLEHLFERHYRGVQASTAIPGSGLGLAIAKELIEQMQGKIEVFSPAPSAWAKQSWQSEMGQDQNKPAPGTTFVVWLSIA